MAQTIPSPSDTPHPLPRYERGRTSAPRAPRPRLQSLDIVWILISMAVFGSVSVATQEISSAQVPRMFAGALTVAVVYLLGWRIAGRGCGITAGLLTATNLGFTLTSVSFPGILFTAFTVSALFAGAAGSLPIAVVLAGIAATIRPDGLLLGLLLLAWGSVRAPKQALPAAGIFLLLLAAGWAGRLGLMHQTFPIPAFFIAPWPLAWVLTPASALLLWLLIPFCADLTDPLRSARWSPLALWLVVYSLGASFVHVAGASDTALPLMPVIFVAAAGGLARLLPILAGETPALRYALATLAVTSLVGLHAWQAWPRSAPQPLPAADASKPLTPIAQPAPAPMPLSTPSAVPVVPAKTRKAVPVRRTATPPSKVAMPAPNTKPKSKATIPLYVLHNGQLVKRSKWAIQWDKTHPKTTPLLTVP